MSDLRDLIVHLESAIEANSSFIETIKYPKLLIKSLRELQGLIGNDDVKNSIASQIGHLILIKEKCKIDSTLKEDKVMLNTLLYGDPGTGKTSIGRILAKVWYSLGYIDGSKRQHIPSASEEKLEDAMAEIEAFKDIFGDLDGTVEDLGAIFFSLLICYWVVLVLGKIIECGNSIGRWWTMCLGLFIFVVFVAMVYFNEKAESPEASKPQNSEKITHRTQISDPPHDEERMPEIEDLITVVSRTDFVDRYSGWTDKKTLKLLNDNLGKVLFVDEAYSLVSGNFDTFGIEVVNTITQFLSEHPGEIIIIFAGYEHLIQRNLFSVQPGLCRRFMWQFECSGYNYSELFEIFSHQLSQRGWSLTDRKATKRLFRRNKDLFPNYGGDTDKLAFFSELEHSRHYLGRSYSDDLFLPNNELSPAHVRRGLRTLRKNNIKVDMNKTNPSISSFLNNLAT